MNYPTPGAYQEALQFPASAFLDPVLQEARPEENALGLPLAITGAFAAVFPVESRTGRWAVKCFLSRVPDQQTRYRAIARHLEAAHLPYTVDFDYQTEGIRVEGQVWPLLKMAWVEGQALNRFVAAHLDRPDVLSGLAAQWASLLTDLQAQQTAHGDLQHGNILVVQDAEGCRLKLVDYDTMYVPALKGRKSPEVGHRNYQHPDRTEEDFGPQLDHFSALVIYLALRACALQPALWARYDTGENLLFRADDFYDPGASDLLRELDAVRELAPLVEGLRTACYLAPAAVPALSDVRSGVPRQHVQRREAGRRPRARRPDRAVPRSGFERAAAPAALAWAAAALALGAAGGLPYGLALFAVGLLVGGVLAWRRYGRLQGVRRRKRLHREVIFFDGILKNLHRQVEALREERAHLLEQAGERRAERLRALREEALYDRLKHHFVGEAAAFDGLSHKVVVRLKAAGIRTAYQATPERLGSLRDVGPSSRARVSLWRAALVAQYRDALPERLSPAEERRLERYVEQRAAGLDAEVERVLEKVRVQQAEQDQVRRRLQETPNLSFLHYLGYLFRLHPLE